MQTGESRTSTACTMPSCEVAEQGSGETEYGAFKGPLFWTKAPRVRPREKCKSFALTVRDKNRIIISRLGRLVATRTTFGTMSERNAGQPADWSGIEKEPNDRGFGR